MENKKGRNIAILILTIILYLGVFLIQGPVGSRIGLPSEFNGVYGQVLVILSVLMVVTNRKRGFITAIILNIIAACSAVMNILRAVRQGDDPFGVLPGVIVPLCTILTIAIIYVYLDRSKKMHDELNENYEQMIEQNRIMREKDEALTFLAYYDRMTGLPNKLTYMDKLGELLKGGKQCTVVQADADDFKRVNDAFGHNVGDEILKAYAERLNAFCENKYIVARTGGDEFSLIISGTHSEAELLALTEQLSALFADPVTVQGGKTSLTMSYGFAAFPNDASSAEVLVDCAASAVYNAKINGKNRPCFFSQATAG